MNVALFGARCCGSPLGQGSSVRCPGGKTSCGFRFAVPPEGVKDGATMGFTPFGSPKGRKRRFALRFPPKGEQTANQRGNVQVAPKGRRAVAYPQRG